MRITLLRILRGAMRRIEKGVAFAKSRSVALADRIAGLPVESPGWLTAELLTGCVARRDPTIVEIGANDGQHTEWFLELFEWPKIFCFEPEERAARRFRARIGECPRVELLEIAIGERDGEATFYRSDGAKGDGTVPDPPEGWDYSGSLRRPRRHLELHPWVSFERTSTVTTRSLDSWCRERDIAAIDLIWMDVQGAERDVLRGARGALARTRYLFTEYSNLELYEGQAGLKDLLAALPGFRPVVRYREDILLENRAFLDPPGPGSNGGRIDACSKDENR